MMTTQKRLYAFEGGTPAFSQNEISAVWPIYGQQEEDALLRVLKSGLWCRLKDDHWERGETGQFEAEFRDYLGASHFLACANGTIAIELALRACDISVGDEVIVQAGTFFGTVTPILRLGAVPVFVDLDEQSFCVDPAEIERAITLRTKAVIVVHLSGLSADMDAIIEICRRRGIPLIEDCAQSAGSSWKNQALGTLGDFGCFSFQQDKPLQSGEGGGVACRDERSLGRIFAFHHGFKVNGAPAFERHEVGTNLRITPWQASILRCQLERLDSQIQKRLENATILESLLGEDSPLEPVRPLLHMTRWSIYSRPFRYLPEKMGGMTRDQFIELVRAGGIPAFEGHVDPLYRRPLFLDNVLNYRSLGCPRTERIASHDYFALMQWFLLGPSEWMERFADVVRRLQRSTATASASKPAAVQARCDDVAPSNNGKPAILGGFPVRPEAIAPRVRLSASARQRVMALIQDGRFSDWYGGPVAREFEDAYARWHGMKYAVAVNSGTSALHLAYEAIGLGPSDEVLVPAGAYISAVSPLVQLGAVPVICDVEPRTWTMDPADVRKRITSHTKAIVPVHFWGAPCQMDELKKIADEFGLKIVEDCAQAHGAQYSGSRSGRVGTFGDIACFSFAPRKHISTGQGGVVLTNSPDYAAFMRQQCNKGKGEGWLDYLRPGYSYVMSEVEAILGLDGLERLDEEIAQRRAAVEIYRAALNGTGLVVSEDSQWGTHVYFKIPVLLPREYAGQRPFILKAIGKENVSVRPPHPPVYRIPWVRDIMRDSGVVFHPASFPVTEENFDRIVELETGPCLPPQEAERSAQAVLKIWRHVQVSTGL